MSGLPSGVHHTSPGSHPPALPVLRGTDGARGRALRPLRLSSEAAKAHPDELWMTPALGRIVDFQNLQPFNVFLGDVVLGIIHAAQHPGHLHGIFNHVLQKCRGLLGIQPSILEGHQHHPRPPEPR